MNIIKIDIKEIIIIEPKITRDYRGWFTGVDIADFDITSGALCSLYSDRLSRR